MGDRSREIISSWAQRDLAESLVKFVEQVRSEKKFKKSNVGHPEK